MTDNQYIDYILRGHRLYWNMLGDMRGNDNHKSDVCWISGGLTYSYSIKLNGSCDSKQIEQIIERIKDKELPDNLIIHPDSAPLGVDLYNAFMETGFFKLDYVTLGMAKELVPDISYPKPDKNLNIYRVNDFSQLKMCGAILNTIFEYDIFAYEHYLDAFNIHNVSFYIAEYNGLPVGACMSIIDDKIVNISWVGTLNGYRKKGIAGHIINTAERDALRNGKSISVLMAYERAINAYSRIGYNGYCKAYVISFTG